MVPPAPPRPPSAPPTPKPIVPPWPPTDMCTPAPQAATEDRETRIERASRRTTAVLVGKRRRLERRGYCGDQEQRWPSPPTTMRPLTAIGDVQRRTPVQAV